MPKQYWDSAPPPLPSFPKTKINVGILPALYYHYLLFFAPNNNDVSPGPGPQRIYGVVYMTVSDRSVVF